MGIPIKSSSRIPQIINNFVLAIKDKASQSSATITLNDLLNKQCYATTQQQEERQLQKVHTPPCLGFCFPAVFLLISRCATCVIQI